MGLTIPRLTMMDAFREAKERANARKGYSREGTRIAHVYNGWPHLSSTTGACMCMDRCCLGDNGCRCGMCSGAGHENCKRARTTRRRAA